MHKENFIKNFLNKILEYEKIAIFCHYSPDFDAYGSSYALYQWLKDNFSKMQKTIFLMIPPNTINNQEKKLFNPSEKFPKAKELKNSLGIILDTANEARILSQMHTYCAELISIDHHPKSETFAQLEFVDPIYPACSQILAEIFEKLEDKYFYSAKVAQYLYAGIVTDTNNMLSSTVLPSTFEIMGRLVLKGINRNFVYDVIYMQTLKQKKFNGYVLNQIKITKNGLAYAIIAKKASRKYAMENVPTMVQILSNIKNVEIWTTLSYDFQFKRWKASIRSRDIQVNSITREFGGGGHKKIAAVVFNKKRDFYKLLVRIDQYLGEMGYKNVSLDEQTASNFLLKFYKNN